jgi:hypothetical protein
MIRIKDSVMKLLPICLTALSLVLFLPSCDKVSNPNKHPNAISSCVLNSPVLNSNSLTANYRKVLVEDYTGHQCGNCPRAAEAADALINTYKDSIVVIANHVSVQFAAPYNDTLYREDFRDQCSTDWDVLFGMSNAGLPEGAVNRLMPYAQHYPNWASLVPGALHQAQSVVLNVTTTYDPAQKLLNVKVKSTFLKAFTNDIKVSILLTQDSVIADQKDYNPPSGCQLLANGETRPNYVFNNINSGSLNGSWGQVIKSSPNVNDTASVSANCYLVNKCFYKSAVCVNDKNIHVVAFVYNSSTYEVLQVERVKIR